MLALLKINKRKQLKEEELKKQIRKRDELNLKRREIEESINEAASEADIDLLEEEVDALETAIGDIEIILEQLNSEIEELEAEAEEAAKKTNEAVRSAARKPVSAAPRPENGGLTRMHRRFKHNMTPERREAYLRREDVRVFYERVQSLAGQTRAITGTELSIPDVTLEILRDNVDEYSKLVKYVYLKQIKGTSRQTIAGEIPEGVWTEMKGAINEMSFDFTQIEVDGFKVGGFIPVHNTDLHDSYINLAAEVEYNIAQAIGYALDKAIVYGLGKDKKMPLGFVTSLAADSDLAVTNISTIDGTVKRDVELFQEIIRAVGKTKPKKVHKSITFLMNEQTWNTMILPESLEVNAAGAYVAASGSSFPILGGSIEFLDFIPLGDIVGGYLEKYLLVEREGASLAVSEHVRFLEDQTLFKGTARYDGIPVRPAAFFAMNINDEEPTTEMDFAADAANA